MEQRSLFVLCRLTVPIWLVCFDWNLNLREKFFRVVGHGNIDDRGLDGVAGHGQPLLLNIIP